MILVFEWLSNLLGSNGLKNAEEFATIVYMLFVSILIALVASAVFYFPLYKYCFRYNYLFIRLKEEGGGGTEQPGNQKYKTIWHWTILCEKQNSYSENWVLHSYWFFGECCQLLSDPPFKRKAFLIYYDILKILIWSILWKIT